MRRSPVALLAILAVALAILIPLLFRLLPPVLDLCMTDGFPACLPEILRSQPWPVAAVVGLSVPVFWILGVFLSALRKRLEESTTTRLNDWLRSADAKYLEQVSKTYVRFKFRGTPNTLAKGIRPPELDQAYVTVRILAGMDRHDVEDRLKKVARREEEGLSETLTAKAEALDLGQALARAPQRRLAIIGIAGSGKSTLLQWAGLACARAGLRLRMTAEQKRFVQAMGGHPPFPILLPLRAYNQYCARNNLTRSPRTLLEFMAHHFCENQTRCDFTVDFFRERLRRPCLLMFDGLDEVNPDDRPAVRAAIEQLVAEYDHPRLYCLVTARPSAQPVAEQLAGFHACEVQRLQPGARNELIRAWHAAVYAEDQTGGRRKAEQLIQRIENATDKVRELATTPLMVTIFCMISYSYELPRLRAKLYEDAVEVLLTEKVFKEDAESLERWGGVSWEMRRDRLALIAFELQKRGTDSMLEGDLVELIWHKFGTDRRAAETEAREFLRLVAQRGGLLEAVDNRYGFFTHATFQEYLAGRYLACEFTPEEQEKFLSDHLADDRWWESIRLAAGFLSIGSENPADRFVRMLARLGRDEAERDLALALAGEALASLLPDRRREATAGEIADSLLTRITLDPPRVPARLRRRLGLALGEVGDPRLPPFPREDRPLPGVREPEMVEIPAGVFRMGTSPEEEQWLAQQKVRVYNDEQPAHQVRLSAYCISRYPVTNLEYFYFMRDHGYERQEFWSVEGWQWRTGKWEADLSVYRDQDLRRRIREWLQRRPVERRDRPFFWDDPLWNAPNLPVVGVTWFEAQAYCNWLSSRLGRIYRLPTEAEWERAARGPAGTPWPWGSEWDPDRCNTAEAEDALRATSPVGMYPQGTWLGGPLDMVGNVWEWCADWYDEETYARRAGQEVLDPTGPERGAGRVVRGGSWYVNRSNARCAFRVWVVPDLFNYFLGFRPVLSPDLPHLAGSADRSRAVAEAEHRRVRPRLGACRKRRANIKQARPLGQEPWAGPTLKVGNP